MAKPRKCAHVHEGERCGAPVVVNRKRRWWCAEHDPEPQSLRSSDEGEKQEPLTIGEQNANDQAKIEATKQRVGHPDAKPVVEAARERIAGAGAVDVAPVGVSLVEIRSAPLVELETEEALASALNAPETVTGAFVKVSIPVSESDRGTFDRGAIEDALRARGAVAVVVNPLWARARGALEASAAPSQSPKIRDAVTSWLRDPSRAPLAAPEVREEAERIALAHLDEVGA